MVDNSELMGGGTRKNYGIDDQRTDQARPVREPKYDANQPRGQGRPGVASCAGVSATRSVSLGSERNGRNPTPRADSGEGLASGGVCPVIWRYTRERRIR